MNWWFFIKKEGIIPTCAPPVLLHFHREWCGMVVYEGQSLMGIEGLEVAQGIVR